MKNIRVFLSGNFQFLEVKFSIYLNRLVFVMVSDGMKSMFFFCLDPLITESMVHLYMQSV